MCIAGDDIRKLSLSQFPLPHVSLRLTTMITRVRMLQAFSIPETCRESRAPQPAIYKVFTSRLTAYLSPCLPLQVNEKATSGWCIHRCSTGMAYLRQEATPLKRGSYSER